MLQFSMAVTLWDALCYNAQAQEKVEDNGKGNHVAFSWIFDTVLDFCYKDKFFVTLHVL